ncbi:hypothetical protein KC238_23550 [Mycobacteroides chelonae]|uniref:hypothetical protein n=1 Tax=Mycobacteroides chelonae TaxID=1774 RepID=UPI001C2BBEC2|nr:hypothetical protein [Mycobacteroides chelonae]MBV0920236.1 hypothetical protein [Mycobacteroides chelonae]
MTSVDRDEPFSPRWLAAVHGVAAVMWEQGSKSQTDGFDEGLRKTATQGGRARAIAAYEQAQQRMAARTEEQSQRAHERVGQIVDDGAALGRAVHDAMIPSPQRPDE